MKILYLADIKKMYEKARDKNAADPMKKYIKKFVLIIFLSSLVFFGCKTGSEENDNSDNYILESVGSPNNLEIITWNMHNFPDNGNNSIDAYKSIIGALDIDIYAVQEIADIYSFQTLISQTPGYKGLYSDDTYKGSYQKTGIIYKGDMFTVLSKEQIYTDKQYEFPRPPLVLYLKVNKGSVELDFYLIVIHLKAYEGTVETDRRRGAVKLLKEYMDSKISSGNEKDIIIAGDWNDELNDPGESNSFTLLLKDSSDYRFLTLEIAGDPSSASYPYKGSLIDHILISSGLFDEYEGGSTKTLILDSKINSYFSDVSDHRPVVSIFPVFN